jgi:hypothetical protein
MRDISVLFEEIVGKIDTSIEVHSYSNKRFYTCNTKWIRVGKIIFGKTAGDADASSVVTNVVKDTYFEIESATLVKSVRCPLPFVITGTKLATNIEFAKKDNNLLNKTPLVWLLENHSETIYGMDSSIERDMEMTVLFLDETDVKNYYTKDHRLQVSEPMIALQEEFEKAINKFSLYKRLEKFNRKVFSRFGTETENGMYKNILDANLSGIIITYTVSKYKDACKC